MLYSISSTPSLHVLSLPQAEQREVSTDVGVQFARAHGCLFVETSAKGNVAVEQAFEELVLKVRSGALLSSGCGMMNVEARSSIALLQRACGDDGAAIVCILGSGCMQPCPDMHLCVLYPYPPACLPGAPAARFWRRPACWPAAAAPLGSRLSSQTRPPPAAAEGSGPLLAQRNVAA